MKHYLKFTPSGSHLLGQKRCDVLPVENGIITMTHGFSFAEHVKDASSVAEAIVAFGLVPHITPALTARQALEKAMQSGIDVTHAGTTYRLKCAESDRNAFSQRTTIFLQQEAYLTAAQKTAFRTNSTTVITDAHGATHTLTIGAYQQLMLAYGAAFDALWTAAAASPAAV